MKFFFPLTFLTLLLVPSDAFAQFGPIVPEVCRTCACGFGGVMAIIQNLVNFIIAIAIIFATIILAWGGGLYILSPMNPESRSTANKMLINAVIGIVVVLSAWLIVDFVMKTLYGGQFGPWNSILGDVSGEMCIEKRENKSLFSGQIDSPLVSQGNYQSSPIVGNEADVRSRLAAAGISVSKNPCPVGVRYQDVSGGCTSVGGLRENTLLQAVKIREICGAYTLTGGSELGHAGGSISHGGGYKIDIRLNDINSCVTGGSNGYFSRSGSRGNDPRYVDKCGNEYVRENDHWDIGVAKVCPR